MTAPAPAPEPAASSEPGSAPEPGASPVPAWVRAGEVLLVVGVTAYCLAFPRAVGTDVALFLVASAAVAALARGGALPAAPDLDGKQTAALVLGGFTAFGVLAMTGYGLVEGTRPDPGVIARVLVIYVLYAALQQYLTQRYLAVRLHGWLRSPHPWKTALVAAALFAILHLPWPQLILPSLGVGFVWSWAYLRLGSVWPVAASHVALAVAFFSFVLVRDPFAGVFG